MHAVRRAVTLATILRGIGIVVGLVAPTTFGSDFPVYWTGSTGERFMGAAGDVDGDGTADLAFVSTGPPSAASPQLAFVRSGVNGSLLQTWTPSLPSFWGFAGSVRRAAGDLNGDGFDDIGVSIINTSIAPAIQLVEVRSGLDGSVMATIPPPPVSNGFAIGFTIGGAGDLDGDGLPELLVSGDYQTSCGSAGQAVYNFEGPTLTLQSYQTSWQCAQGFGSDLGRVDDVDGDGLADYYIGAWRTDSGPILDVGWIGVFSGATGALISSLYGTATGEYLGASVTGLSDVTGDGMPELVVPRLNGLAVLSLPSFAVVYQLPATLSGTVQTLGDSDGDGFDDFLVHWSTGPFPYTEVISAFSGPTGALIGQVAQNIPAGALYPWGALGDVNGDGLGDFAATPWQIFGSPPPIAVQGLWSPWSWPMTDGAVRVYVSPNLGVVGTPAVGGTAQLQVVAPKHAGRPFQVVFAEDYVFPAIPVGPFLFPVALDAMFWATLAAGIVGTLDASGQGSVAVPIPNVPALHGAWFNASGVVYDAAGPLGIGCVLTHAGFQIP